MRRCLAYAVLALLASAALPHARVEAQTTDDAGTARAKSTLESVQQRLIAGQARRAALQKQAADLAAEIARYQQESVDVAHEAQQYEADLTGLETQLADLDHRQKDLQAGLAAHKQRQAVLLAALQRIAVEPPAALAFSPGKPVDSLRSAMLIGALEPQLKAEAAALAASLNELTALRAETDAKRSEIVVQATGLSAKRDQLADLTRRRQALEGSVRSVAAGQQRQVVALAARAGNLKSLVDRLQQEAAERAAAAAEAARRQAEEAAAAAAAAAAKPAKPAESGASAGSGSDIEVVSAGAQHAAGGRHRTFEIGAASLIAPVTGRITQRFGATDGFVTAKGLTIATQPRATVVSPFDGQVLFAGPFKGYGQILIIDHGGGYASLLARVDHIDAVIGQWVVAGEPVGTMAASGSPALYMEFRHKDQPINPLPLLGNR
jgi:septal ring factor EnvC (AmiA/AmiB activator)